MTTVQASLNELNAFQDKEGYQLAGCGPRMKTLAGEIKVLFPTLTDADKGLFTAAVARGRFSIEAKYIWPLFCEAVGAAVPVPAPKPAAPAATAMAPAPQTNKVAAEILELCIGINLSQVKQHARLGEVDGRLGSMNDMILTLITTISDLRKQVAELKKPANKRALTSV